jgi:L-alanine-DL-glutamate epimerase-like enolase superfamily enzyme
MRIAEMRTTTVSVPFATDELWAYGRRRGVTNILIELETDDGLVGLGEAVGWPTPRIAEAVLETFRDVVLGSDPFHTEALTATLLQRRGWHYFRHTLGCSLAGVEMACWDLVGKACGLPLHVLFGGAVRDRVPYYTTVTPGDPEDMARQAREGVERGFGTVYLKIGFGNGGDLYAVRAVRDAIGRAARLRVDANEAWSAGEAVAEIRRLEELDIEFVEQPVNMYDLDALTYVRERVTVPIGGNQTTWDEFATLDALKRPSVDAVVSDPHQVGGLARFKKIAALAEIADAPIVKHSFGDLGVCTLATAHVLATCPNAGLGHQTHYHHLADDVIVGGKPEFEDGGLSLPDGPGIGVELDRERVDRYAELYAREGWFSPYEPISAPA